MPRLSYGVLTATDPEPLKALAALGKLLCEEIAKHRDWELLSNSIFAIEPVILGQPQVFVSMPIFRLDDAGDKGGEKVPALELGA